MPEKSEQTERFAANIAERLSEKFKVLDSGLSEAAFRSMPVPDPFNLTIGESRQLASVAGCDYFLILRSATQRRSSLEKADYYEAFAVLYLVNGRTGGLDHWDLKSFEGSTAATAERLLFDSAANIASEIVSRIEASRQEKPPLASAIENVPDDGSPGAAHFRAPVPYKRIRPEYTRTAYLYDVRATIDVSVDFDETGKVTQTNIERWAGFGLDESVIAAVKKMNWRPAMRNGKPLPMRVLLRYNFTKIEKD